MATYYAVNAGGNWQTAATWSTVATQDASRVGNGSIPTAADECILDSYSGNMSVDNAACACRSLDCDGFTGTLNFSDGKYINIGDATAGTGNKALRASTTMTVGNGGLGSGFKFVSTSTTVQTIDFQGKGPRNGTCTFNAASNGSWQLISPLNTDSYGTIILTKGTLDVNGQTCSWGAFSSSTSTKTLTLGNAAITIAGANQAWLLSATGTTLTANTATITMTGLAYPRNGLTNGESFVLTGTGSSGSVSLEVGTYTNVTRTGGNTKTDVFYLRGDVTIGTLTINSNSDLNRLFVASSTAGTPRTITAANVVITNTVDFQDITGAGAATWTVAGTGATAIGDCGGNSGITTTTPATQTCTISTNKNWSDATIWTSRVPLPQDNVSGASITGGTLTADMPRLGHDVDFTGATGTPTMANTIVNTMYGTLTMATGMSTSGTNSLIFSGRDATDKITANGVIFTFGLTLNTPTGTYTLQDNVTTSKSANPALLLSLGVLTDNGKTVTLSGANSTFTMSGGTLNKTGIWNLAGTANASNIWNVTGGTINDTDGSINITSATANSRNFVTFGKTYKTLNYTVTGSSGELNIVNPAASTTATIGTINFYDNG